MKTTIYLVACLLLSLLAGCKDENESYSPVQKSYLIIAQETLKTMNVVVDDFNIFFDEDNVEFNRYLEANDIPELKNKEFQTLIFFPKTKSRREFQLGGEIWIFIDKVTKNVLHVHTGK
jgi:hypothetical protein